MALAVSLAMESVVAAYQDLNTAEHAVRALERSGFSIQDVSISDESKRVWRSLHPAWARRSPAQSARRGFALAAVLLFVAAQLGLDTLLPPGSPMWLVVFGICVLGACLGAGLGWRRDAGLPPKPPGFYLILRADAATTEAVRTYFAKLAVLH